MNTQYHGMHFVLCPRQSNKIEGVALNGGMYILGFFCPKQGSKFQTLYSNIGVVTPPPPFPLLIALLK